MAKARYLFFFLITIFFLLFFKNNAQAASLELSPSSGSYQVGENFIVDVKLSLNNESVDGVDVLLNFDKNLLQVNAITTGELFANYPTQDFNNTQGTISISSLAPPGSPVTKGGVIASISFQAKASGNAQVSFNFTPGSGNDSNVTETETGNDILSEVVNGSYSLNGSQNPPVGGAGKEESGEAFPSGSSFSTPSALPVSGSFHPTFALLFLGFSFLILSAFPFVLLPLKNNR